MALHCSFARSQSLPCCWTSSSRPSKSHKVIATPNNTRQTRQSLKGRPPPRRCQDGDAFGAHAQEEADVPSPSQIKQEDCEELLPEEDWTVPGDPEDGLNSRTKLGKAVKEACQELEHLAALEKESLQQCNDLLQKLGVNVTSLDARPPEKQE